jgi:hypothetical protein
MGPPNAARMSGVSIFRVYWVCSHAGAATSKLAADSADESLVLLNPEINNSGNAVQTKYIKDIDEIKSVPRAKNSCVKTARPPCIFTAKSIMFLALIYWVIYLVPVYLESLEIGVTIVWLGAVLLLSMKKDYAGLLIAVLAAYNFVHDFIVELPKFKSTATHIAATQNIAQSIASVSLIILLSLEVVFLVCFLYYVVYILSPSRRYPF